MKLYVDAIQARIKIECNRKDKVSGNEMWLLNLLLANNFWICPIHAQTVCVQPGLQMEVENYYKDICVWFPDLQYHMNLTCPCFEQSDKVAVHGY